MTDAEKLHSAEEAPIGIVLYDDDDEPCERCGLVEACMCGEPRHDVDPRDLT